MQSIAYRRHGNPEDGPGLGLRLREMQKSCYPSAAGLAPGKMRSGGKNPSDCRILHGLVASRSVANARGSSRMKAPWLFERREDPLESRLL